MKLHRALFVLAAGALAASAFGFAGCGGPNDGLAGKTFDFGDEYYRSVATRYKLNYDEMLYDDFKDGIDLDRWVISDSVWEAWETDQSGVRPQNVFLVNDPADPDTHLLLRANGSYYDMSRDDLYTAEEKAQYGDGKTLFTQQQGYGVNTGACLSTVEALGPGRYDVKMKACPRVGALTSMWVYSWFTLNDGSTQQNEIDIELGLKPDFSHAFYTTWTSPSNNSNFDQPLEYFVNDGNWHIYSFDWVTDAEIPYVDYYIDGIKTMTIDSNVPTTNATLNLGIWCPSWAGGGVTDPDKEYKSPDSRMFESDFAQISWWRYIPFEMENWEQRPVQNRNHAEGYVPKTLTKVPVAEKCANGDFERGTDSYGYYGNPWIDYTVKDESLEAFVPDSSVDPEYIENAGSGTQNTCAEIKNGGLLGQWLRGATTGFKYKLTGRYRTTGDAVAAFRYTYLNGYATTSQTNGNKTLEIGSSAEWKSFEIEFTVDKDNIRSIRYYLMNKVSSGNCYFDDISLTYLGI